MSDEDVIIAYHGADVIERIQLYENIVQTLVQYEFLQQVRLRRCTFRIQR